MATTNNTSIVPDDLTLAEFDPAAAAVVVREFRRLFPTLQLTNFNAAVLGVHWIRLEGSESELLRIGILDQSMIPIRPKRHVRLTWGLTRRLKGDRVEVRMDLKKKELDPSHPLAPLSEWNWENLVPAKRRPRNIVLIEEIGRVMGIAGESLSEHAAKIINQLGAAMIAEINADCERVEYQRVQSQRSHLRLVVDNRT